MTEAWRDFLARLNEGLGTREPFLLVTGDAGTGKTALVLEAAARWEGRASVAFLSNPSLTRAELVEEIARRFGAEPPAGASKPQLLACIEKTFTEVAGRKQVPVIVMEDAHLLDSELLEELRAIVNSETQAQRHIEVVLVGHPALETRLAEPALASLRQRISVRCQMKPLSHKETRHYLHHRVRAVGGDGPRLFPRKTCSEIHDHSHGVPRAINTLATEAMRRAKEAGSDAVTAEHVQASAAEHPVAATTAAHRAPERPSAAEPPRPKPAPKPAPAPGSRPAAAPVPKAAAAPAPASEPVAAAAPAAVMSGAAGASATDSATLPEPIADPLGAEAATLAVSPPSVPDVPSDDPRVRDWVKRFVGNQGPPRVGSAFHSLLPDEADASFEDAAPVALDPTTDGGAATVVAASRETSVEASGEAAPTASKESGRPLKLIRYYEDEPEPAPAADAPEAESPRAAKASSRSNGHGSWLSAASLAVAVFAITGVGTVMVLTHGQNLIPTGDASNVSTTDQNPGVGATAPTATERESTSAHHAGSGGSASSIDQTEGSTKPTASDVVPDDSSPAEASDSAVTPQTNPGDVTDGSASPAASPNKKQRLALEVATFIDAERARLECSRLVAETGLRAWVVTASEYGGQSYRVRLGVFTSSDRAEAAANNLLERGLISESRVVELPARRSRRTRH